MDDSGRFGSDLADSAPASTALIDERPATQHERRQLVAHVVTLFLLPLIFILINDTWIFNPAAILNSNDPWIYNGMFRRYPDVAQWLGTPGNLYVIERVSWNALGYLIYQVLPAVWANYLLHLLVYYLGVYALYALVRLHVGGLPALVTSLLLGTYVWYLTAVGHDYVDGYNVAILLLAFYLLSIRQAAPLSSRSVSLRYTAGGAAFALLLTSNFGLLSQLPVLGVFALLQHVFARRSWRQTVASAVSFGLGFAASLVLMSLLYFQFTGRWNVWELTIESVERLRRIYAHAVGRADILAGYGHIPSNWHLLPILAASGAGVLFWHAHKLSRQQRNYLCIAAVIFGLTYAYWVFAHFTIMPYLIVYLYMSYLIPAAFILLAGIIAFVHDRYPSLFKPRWLAFYACVLLAPAAASAFAPALREMQQNVVLLAGVFATCALALVRLARWKWSLPTLIVGLSLLGFLGARSMPLFSDREVGRATFLRISSLLDEIDRQYPGRRDLQRYWLISQAGSFDSFMVAMAYQQIWSRWIRLPFPGAYWTFPTFPPAQSQDTVIVGGADVLDLAQQYLAAGNLVIEKINQELALGSTQMAFTQIAFDFNMEFNQRIEPFGDNFHGTELVEPGNIFRWTGPDATTTIPFRLPEYSSDVQLKICILFTLNPENFAPLKIWANDYSLEMTQDSTSEDCPYPFTGIIPQSALHAAEVNILKIFAEPVKPPVPEGASDVRELGVAIDWLHFVPLLATSSSRSN